MLCATTVVLFLFYGAWGQHNSTLCPLEPITETPQREATKPRACSRGIVSPVCLLSQPSSWTSHPTPSIRAPSVHFFESFKLHLSCLPGHIVQTLHPRSYISVSYHFGGRPIYPLLSRGCAWGHVSVVVNTCPLVSNSCVPSLTLGGQTGLETCCQG